MLKTLSSTAVTCLNESRNCYSYNTESSIRWIFKNKSIKIRYADESLPRQFFITENTNILASLEHFRITESHSQITGLLKGKDEFSDSNHIEQACKLIALEVQKKFEVYYNFVEDGEDLDLGPFTYQEFKKAYAALLTKALYHRYYAWANQAEGGIIYLPIDDLISDLSVDTGLPQPLCRTIVKTISYSHNAKSRKIDAVYYSLYYLEGIKMVVLSPNDFARWPGFTNVYRIAAHINPKQFQEKVSDTLSRNFVQHVARAFRQQGLSCFTDVKLNKFDPTLPDLDVVAVSEEPTLGYYLFLCEVKNPIPPMWAKDHLRAKDLISKSFIQIAKITSFLNTEQGILFIRNQLLPKEGHVYLGEKFVIAAQALVVTSNNAGMFFGDETIKIIDYNTLERILTRSDGDVVYISHMLKTLNPLIEKCYRKVPLKCTVDNMKVTYEGVQIKRLMDLPEHVYKSDGIDKLIAEDYFEQDFHPFDMFDHRKDD